MEEWFLNEFAQYGFSTSPTVYDAFTFAPIKFVMFQDRYGVRKTNIKLTPELTDDLQAYGLTYDHHVEALRELVRMEIRRQFPDVFKSKDFRPIEKITKLSFI